MGRSSGCGCECDNDCVCDNDATAEALTRRRVLAGTVGVAAVAALAACSSGDAGNGSSSAPVGTPGGATATGGGTSATDGGAGEPLASTAEVPEGGGVIVTGPQGAVVVTQPAAGEFKAFSATCPHASCTVARVEADRILCTCHGSVFDATTGDRLDGPATSGLTPLTVVVDGSSISLA